MAKNGKGGLSTATIKDYYAEQQRLAESQARTQALYQTWLRELGEECVNAGFTQAHNELIPEALRLAKHCADLFIGIYTPEAVKEALTMVHYALQHEDIWAIFKQTIEEEELTSAQAPRSYA